MNYKFNQFDEPIDTQSWYLRNVNLEYGTVEIILIDVDAKLYSHTFNEINLDGLISELKTKVEVLLKNYEVTI
jgi:hypothetical protein